MTLEEVKEYDAARAKSGYKCNFEKMMSLPKAKKLDMGKDVVWEKEYGYEYFYVHVKLSKGMYITWSPEDRVPVLVRHKGGWIKNRIICTSEDQFNMWCGFFFEEGIAERIENERIVKISADELWPQVDDKTLSLELTRRVEQGNSSLKGVIEILHDEYVKES